MKTATFISCFFFLFFAILGVVHAMPEPVQAGSIEARDGDASPALDGLSELVARGDKGHGDHDKCWNKHGWDKCSKWGYCCKKYQTCCGGSKCCDKGYKCVRKGKDRHDDDHDDDHHKRGDDDHHGHGYRWYCKKERHGW